MLIVTSKKLITTITREGHSDMLARVHAQYINRYRRRVRKRLIDIVEYIKYMLVHIIRRNAEYSMIGLELLCNQISIVCLIEIWFILESDGEGIEIGLMSSSK